MNMSEFFAMGGYGLYVWGSYGVTALVLAIEVIMLLQRKKSVQRRLARLTAERVQA
ncbi:MAG: heme exporter protein CcmD [Gammaproteobacteria bacterium]